MSAPPSERSSDVADPERALKYAIQHHAGDRVQDVAAVPRALGYTRAVGPLPFGEPVELPEPFGLRVDTSGS
ncbi:hypothetical protein [Kitasatospora sp. NPDC090308]|uniref:hypothetical protein n=1 Tax=Kitasatospora sp. NPDC090308 TaxID=3364082 RepID=UPI0038171D44